MTALNDLDVWRSAHVLVRAHGSDAVFVATRRADKMLDEGDVAGFSVWRRIGRAIVELTRSRAPGTPLN